MITPHEQLTDEYYEGRLLSSFLNTLYDAEISLKLREILSTNCENVNISYNNGIFTLSFKGNFKGKVAITLKNRRSLVISIYMRQEASKVI